VREVVLDVLDDLRVVLPPDQSLRAIDGVARVHHHLVLGDVADEKVALLAHRHHAGEDQRPFVAGDDARDLVAHVGDARVGCAQIDAKQDGLFGGHEAVRCYGARYRVRNKSARGIPPFPTGALPTSRAAPARPRSRCSTSRTAEATPAARRGTGSAAGAAAPGRAPPASSDTSDTARPWRASPPRRRGAAPPLRRRGPAAPARWGSARRRARSRTPPAIPGPSPDARWRASASRRPRRLPPRPPLPANRAA